MLTTHIKPGDKLYYPSVKGIALICEVVDKSEKDVLVLIDDKQFYLPNESVDAHGIIIDEDRAKSYITQRIEDPDNSIVYLRYTWKETWVDKAYNAHCSSLNRIDEPVVIKANPNPVTPDSTPPIMN